MRGSFRYCAEDQAGDIIGWGIEASEALGREFSARTLGKFIFDRYYCVYKKIKTQFRCFPSQIYM